MRVYVEEPMFSLRTTGRRQAAGDGTCPVDYGAEAKVFAWNEQSADIEPWARVWNGNVLAENTSPPRPTAPTHLICWSGSLGEDLWVRHPGNWMSTGRVALGRWVEAVASATGSDGGGRWLLTPHCRHVLSDIPSVEEFVRAMSHLGIGIALEPTALFETEMLEHRLDHLDRILNALGSSASAVILSDRRVPTDADKCLNLCGIGSGVFDADELLGLMEKSLPAETPIIVRDGGGRVGPERRAELAGLLGAVAGD